MTGDTLTVLTTTTGKLATKQFSLHKDGKVRNRSYGNEKYYAVTSVAVSDIHSLARALDQIMRDPHSFVIRGEPRADKATGEPAAFAEQPRHWFSVDIDHIPCPALTDPITDPEAGVEYVIGLLPPEFHDATCWWQYSASQSVSKDPQAAAGSLSLHLWYWSAEPLDCASLTRWALAANQLAGAKVIGPEFFRTVQPHYIAAPIFISPLTDPLPRRCGLRPGLDDEVALVIPPPAPKRPYEPSTAGYEPDACVEHYLRQIGGPAGFRDPIRKAIASYIATWGSNADLQPLYRAIRAALDRAEPEWRSDPNGERYAGDEHLDKIAAWTRQQHGDQPPKGDLGEPPAYFDEIPPAAPPPIAVTTAGVALTDFWAYMPQHNYIYAPSREPWPGSSVNARLPRVPLFDVDGNPVLDGEGEQVEISATTGSTNTSRSSKRPGRRDCR